MDRVLVLDTTLRDGEQSPGASMTKEEKVEIARQLERLGVDIIEAGFAASSPGDFEAVKMIAQEIKDCTVTALARAVKSDIDAVWESVKYAQDPLIHMVLGVSDIHITGKFRRSREEILEMGVEAVEYARKYCPSVQYSTEDAGRADLDYLCLTVEKVIAAGATIVNIPDTTGYCTPWVFGEIIRRVIERVPNIHKAIVSVHCHNDLGMATANTLAAVLAGARKVEVTINGIGERAGNTSLEEVVMALKTRKDILGLETRVNTREIYRTSRMVSNITGMVVQPNKAIVGANAFAHSSGIHQDGVLKDRRTYEIMNPGDVGVPQSRIVLSARSGRHALRHRLEALNVHLPEDRFQRVYQRFLAVADKKKEVHDEDLIAIVSNEVQPVVEAYRLERVQVSCGTPLLPTATVEVRTKDGQLCQGVATGTGPVDAAFKALDQAVGIPARLEEFSVQSVTAGVDALGEVSLRLESQGRRFGGRGADTDIIVASAKAYVNALNKVAAAQPAHWQESTEEGAAKAAASAAV